MPWINLGFLSRATNADRISGGKARHRCLVLSWALFNLIFLSSSERLPQYEFATIDLLILSSGCNALSFLRAQRDSYFSLLILSQNRTDFLLISAESEIRESV